MSRLRATHGGSWRLLRLLHGRGERLVVHAGSRGERDGRSVQRLRGQRRQTSEPRKPSRPPPSRCHIPIGGRAPPLQSAASGQRPLARPSRAPPSPATQAGSPTQCRAPRRRPAARADRRERRRRRALSPEPQRPQTRGNPRAQSRDPFRSGERQQDASDKAHTGKEPPCDDGRVAPRTCCAMLTPAAASASQNLAAGRLPVPEVSRASNASVSALDEEEGPRPSDTAVLTALRSISPSSPSRAASPGGKGHRGEGRGPRGE